MYDIIVIGGGHAGSEACLASARLGNKTLLVTGNINTVKLHRLIMGARKGEVVDHLNGNTYDNRKCNLRITDHSGNLRNTGKYKNNTSGYRGVQELKDGRRKKWKAEVTIESKTKYLGSAYTAKEAAILHDVFINEHFPDCPRALNFPKEFSNG